MRPESLILAEAGRSKYRIRIPVSASITVRFAAEERRSLLVIDDPDGGEPAELGGCTERWLAAPSESDPVAQYLAGWSDESRSTAIYAFWLYAF